MSCELVGYCIYWFLLHYGHFYCIFMIRFPCMFKNLEKCHHSPNIRTYTAFWSVFSNDTASLLWKEEHNNSNLCYSKAPLGWNENPQSMGIFSSITALKMGSTFVVMSFTMLNAQLPLKPMVSNLLRGFN